MINNNGFMTPCFTIIERVPVVDHPLPRSKNWDWRSELSYGVVIGQVHGCVESAETTRQSYTDLSCVYIGQNQVPLS